MPLADAAAASDGGTLMSPFHPNLPSGSGPFVPLALGRLTEGGWAAKTRIVARAIYPLLYGASVFCLWKLAGLYRPATTKVVLAWLAVIAGWLWLLFAGGGGLGLLLLRGPWPPTNGWFALLSGLVACPLIGRLLRNSTHLRVSGWQQFGAAVLLVSMGRIALLVWPQPHPL